MKKGLILSLAGLFSWWSLWAQAPEGYYQAAEGKSGEQLKTALYNIIKGGNRLSYGSGSNATWSGFEKTDLHPDGYVWDMYSNNKVPFPGGGRPGSGMNIEHSVAKSWWGGSNNDAYKDLHHLNPSNSTANSAKGSYPPGIISSSATFNNGVIKVGNNSFGSEYNGKAFEVIDEYKGDFARAYLYMFTCYQNFTWTGTSAPTFINNGEVYPMLKQWAADLLLSWSRLDPVSTKEVNRNEEVYKIQTNRNPYIDYPDLVEYLWGNKKGEAFSFIVSTDPRVTTPSKGATIPVKDTYFLDSSTEQISLKGAFMTGNVSIALSGPSANRFALLRSTVSAEEMNAGCSVGVVYTPGEVASHSCTITISGGGLSEPVQATLTGRGVDNFVMLTPSNVTADGFTARWTAVSGATGYQLSLVEVSQSGEEPVLLAQNHCTETPQGWATGSGYTDYSTESSFIRLASGSNPGSLITPALDLSQGAYIEVTAKQYRTDSNVTLTVSVDDQPVTTINLTADNIMYPISLDPETASSKITFTAASGKRALVDLINIYTNASKTVETPVVGYPQSLTALNHSITGLAGHVARTFYVEVKALGTPTELVTERQYVVLPAVDSSVDQETIEGWRVGVNGDKIIVRDAPLNAVVDVISIDGRVLLQDKVDSEVEEYQPQQQGVLLVRVTSEGLSKVVKVVLSNR